MSFAGKHSCFAFTLTSIRQNAPAIAGIYALSNAREWVLIAEAEDIRAALHAHLASPGTRLRYAAPTGFSFEQCDATRRKARVARLILDLSPSCNDRTQV